MKKALITGITGFVGSHLSELLIGKGFEVHGLYRWRSRTANIDHIKENLNLIYADITDYHSVESAIGSIKPDYIFHLAAQSFVPVSWTAPSNTVNTNIIGQLNLLEAVRKLNLDTKIQIAGSSEEYGIVKEDETPIKETNPLRPSSPYAVSKICQEMLGYQYFVSYGMKIILTRGFNHTGPRRGDVFVTSSFAKQVAEIENGKRKPILHVGNLTAIRDFTDVRDMVKGYLLAIEKCKLGEPYNIATGKGYRIQEVVDLLLAMTKKKIEIKQDQSRMRPSDVPILIGDYTKFKNQTGWEPAISFEKTLEDTLDYWRGIV